MSLNVCVIRVAGKVATQLIPPCAPATHYPDQTYGDGNSLFRAVTVALTGIRTSTSNLGFRHFLSFA